MAMNNRVTTCDEDFNVTYQDEVTKTSEETSDEIERKLAVTKFKEIHDKLSNSHWDNEFMKNLNPAWLKFFAYQGEIHVCDCSKDGNENNHKLILNYDEKNNFFNLTKFDGRNESWWNNISSRDAISFLNQISDKIKNKNREDIINKTSNAIKDAVMTMFDEGKNWGVRKILKSIKL